MSASATLALDIAANTLGSQPSVERPYWVAMKSGARVSCPLSSRAVAELWLEGWSDKEWAANSLDIVSLVNC